MKVTNAEVAHLWANKEFGYEGYGNFYSHEDEKAAYLVSYHTIMAVYNKEEDIFIQTLEKYSVTTAKQMSRVNYPNHANVIYIPLDFGFGRDAIIDSFLNEIEDHLGKYSRARKYKNLYLHDLKRLHENLVKFMKYSKGDFRKFPGLKSLDTNEYNILEYWEKRLKKVRDKKIAAAKKRKNAAIKAKKDFIAKYGDKLKRLNRLIWLSFYHDHNKIHKNLVNTYKSLIKNSPIYNPYYENIYSGIKIAGHDILTSQGLRFSIEEAKRFYLALRANRVKVGDYFSHYQIEKIDSDKIKIGCHLLSRENLEKVYNEAA